MLPRCSMYGIFTYIWEMFGVNVGKYSIHHLGSLVLNVFGGCWVAAGWGHHSVALEKWLNMVDITIVTGSYNGLYTNLYLGGPHLVVNSYILFLGFHSHGGTPLSLDVFFFRENPIYKWMMKWGTHICGNPHI